MYKDIIYEVNGSLATIRFNRPEVGNAFSVDSFREIPQAIDEASQNPNVRVVVLTGQGKLFCGGGDINQFKTQIESEEGPGLDKDLFVATGKVAVAIRNCPKPVIASINGAAAGAGLGVALAADFRIMEEKSSLVTSFIQMGFPGDTGVGYFLQQLVGTAKATELLMLSPKIKGDEAKELGLATIVCEDGQLAEATDQFAQKIASLPSLALAQQKDLLNKAFYASLPDYILAEAEHMFVASQSQDHVEAVSAFLEKRLPVFKGQ